MTCANLAILFVQHSSTRHFNNILAWHRYIRPLSPLRDPCSTPRLSTVDSDWERKLERRREGGVGTERGYEVNTYSSCFYSLNSCEAFEHYFYYGYILSWLLTSSAKTLNIIHFQTFLGEKLYPLRNLEIANFHLSSKTSTYLEDSKSKGHFLRMLFCVYQLRYHCITIAILNLTQQALEATFCKSQRCFAHNNAQKTHQMFKLDNAPL